MGIINRLMILLLLSHTIGLIGVTSAQLSETFYNSTCPNVVNIIHSGVLSYFSSQTVASLLRLHFADCFVNGCDASVLLEDTATFTGEKTATANNNSLKGFEVIDRIKERVERACPGVVSCADILAVIARISVWLSSPTRGVWWRLRLGRRDSTTASLSDANTQIPSHELNLDALISAFAAKGFSPRELVALSGAHTIGLARCISARNRIYNETSIDATFAGVMKRMCPASGRDNNVLPLDSPTWASFDTFYFDNLVRRRGLLHSDQQLFNGGSTDSIVQQYRTTSGLFLNDFAAAMLKMSELSPLTGTDGEIRRNCRLIN